MIWYGVFASSSDVRLYAVLWLLLLLDSFWVIRKVMDFLKLPSYLHQMQVGVRWFEDYLGCGNRSCLLGIQEEKDVVWGRGGW